MRIREAKLSEKELAALLLLAGKKFGLPCTNRSTNAGKDMNRPLEVNRHTAYALHDKGYAWTSSSGNRVRLVEATDQLIQAARKGYKYSG